MAKVELNFSPIASSGISALDNAIDNIKSVIAYLQRNVAPSDFNKYYLLLNTLSDLKKQRDKLVYLKEWLKDSNSNYDSFIAKLDAQALKLPAYSIKRRTKIVK